ncbi:MAG: phage holin family protein [Prochloraceae cyanobacterium]|nr:phage holin family protein [Prochloraceae cyanobacterium]
MDIGSFLITALVTAVSLVIISKLPLGIEVDSFGKAFIAGIVFGFLNALVQPVLNALGILNLLSLGIFGLVVNGIVFGLAAWLVEGFRLKWGLISLFLGAIALSFVNSLLMQVLMNLK